MLIFLWWLSLMILSGQVFLQLYHLSGDVCSMHLAPFLITTAYSGMKSGVRVGAKAAVAWKLPHHTCTCVRDAVPA